MVSYVLSWISWLYMSACALPLSMLHIQEDPTSSSLAQVPKIHGQRSVIPTFSREIRLSTGRLNGIVTLSDS